ncbi:MAG: long-chain acyl-[acyl-carrier-protein] reductase [Cyanobacteria bacterium]|nr:long-chain acyl-[acyl-carrier-protein] reductase [Cyanobacteriota bacterium]
MFGLIGHSPSLTQAHIAARELGFPEYADRDLEFWCSAPPQIADTVRLTSLTGETIEGRYIDSCFLPEMLMNNRGKTAVRKILNAMAHAQKYGIQTTALGGFSSIVFENFKLYQMRQVRNVQLEFERFTTGNTHTAYIICRQVELMAERLNLDLGRSTVAVVGATGDIGSAVCRWLSTKLDVQDLLLVARQQDRLEALAGELGRGKVLPMEEALPLADVIVWVASMPKGVEIDADGLKKPCLIVDGGYPKNLGTRIQHPEIHILSGGIVEHAIGIESKIMRIIGMAEPARQVFACFAESMLLEFEKWYTNFSWSRNQITVAKMEQIGQASVKHGFSPLLLEVAS